MKRAGASTLAIALAAPLMAGTAQALPLMDPDVFSDNGNSIPGAQLRDAINDAAGVPNAGLTGFAITPSIGLQETYTDNVNQTHSNRQPDFITQLTPSITASAQTPRLTGNLNYSPTLSWYAETPGNNYINQSLAGTGLATLVPDALFVQAAAYASTISAFGGLTGAPGQILNQQNRTSVESFSLGPYFLHEFAPWGTLRVGANIGYTTTNYNGVPSGFGVVAPNTNNGDQITTEETASFTTGEFLSQFQYTIAVDGQQLQGTTGTTSGAYNYSVNNTLNYAVNRWLTLTASAGWQTQYYNTVPSTNISGLTWNLGGTITPNPDSVITFGYGHSNGFDSFNFAGTYALGGRTNISLNYSESLGVTLQQIQQALNGAYAGPNGILYSASTGAPLDITNSLFATQTNLTRNKVLTASITHIWERDTLTFSLNGQNQVFVARSTTSIENSQRGVTAAVSFNHDLRPDLSLSLYADYGYQEFYNIGGIGSATQTQRVYDFSAAMTYTFTPTLTGNVRYLFTNRNVSPDGTVNGTINNTVNGTNFSSFYQNIFTVGIVKTF